MFSGMSRGAVKGLRDLLRITARHPVKAAAIIYWWATKRTMRAKGRFEQAVSALPFVYEHWVKDGILKDRALVADLTDEALIAVHLHIEGTTDHRTAIASVIGQTWPHWHLILTHDCAHEVEIACDPRITTVACRFPTRAEGLKAALEVAGEDYIVPLSSDCILPAEALTAYALHIARLHSADRPILYGDQDEIGDHRKRTNPWFKPDWDADMFLTQDYISLACALPISSAHGAREGIAGEEPVFSLLLHLAVLGQHKVQPVHRVTVSTPRNRWQQPAHARLTALQAVVAPLFGIELGDGPFGSVSIRWPLPEVAPLVTIIVPTRDRMDILGPCIEGVLKQTTYPRFEIVIADNGSVERETLSFFDRMVSDPRVSVVHWPYPYNYSAINNFAARHARGTYLCLLNNDTEVVNGEWLGELMRQACRPGVGAVGARLLYPDGSIQHAGVTVGMGNAAGHAHRGLADGRAGYFAHALIAREATAVTAACLVVAKGLFDAVGGLDEEYLQIAYNDVDLCLKLRSYGVRNIYAPTAVLIHHESKSRGQDMAPEHLARYMAELTTLQERWDTMNFQDPTHHPSLVRSSEIYLACR